MRLLWKYNLSVRTSFICVKTSLLWKYPVISNLVLTLEGINLKNRKLLYKAINHVSVWTQTSQSSSAKSHSIWRWVLFFAHEYVVYLIELGFYLFYIFLFLHELWRTKIAVRLNSYSKLAWFSLNSNLLAIIFAK